jgi:hypothetical protein
LAAILPKPEIVVFVNKTLLLIQLLAGAVKFAVGFS